MICHVGVLYRWITVAASATTPNAIFKIYLGIALSFGHCITENIRRLLYVHMYIAELSLDRHIMLHNWSEEKTLQYLCMYTRTYIHNIRYGSAYVIHYRDTAFRIVSFRNDNFFGKPSSTSQSRPF